MPDGVDLEPLYDEHAQALFAFLLNVTRNEDDTRDVLQEIFIKLALQPRLVLDARDLRAFLLRLAHNRVIDLSRRRCARDKYHEQFGVEHVCPFAPGEKQAGWCRGFRSILRRLERNRRRWYPRKKHRRRRLGLARFLRSD